MKAIFTNALLRRRGDLREPDPAPDSGRRGFLVAAGQAGLSGAVIVLGLSACNREEPAIKAADAPATETPSLMASTDPRVVEKARAWIREASRMVEAAGSGSADAHAFKQQVEGSRESLRELVRSVAQTDRESFQDMVLMVALLDSAAACHKGGHIICPPDLMQQLRAQQARLQAQLGAST